MAATRVELAGGTVVEVDLTGADSVLGAPALALVSSREESDYGDLVAAAALEVCAREGLALWVRASPSGAERAALREAPAASVPVVMWCAAPAAALPAGLFAGCDPAATAVVSTAAAGASAGAVRDRCCGELPVAVLAAEASRDVAAVVGHGFAAGTPVVALHPPGWAPSARTAVLHAALAGTGRVDRLGWPPEVCDAAARREVPANAVCADVDDLAAAVGVLARFSARSGRTGPSGG